MILRDAINRYVAWRRAHGARFITSARTLYQFCHSLPERVCCDAVTEDDVRRFLVGIGPLTRSRANKYGALAGFYRYAVSRGHALRSPLPPADEEPREPPSAPPYIYSREELKRLFAGIDVSRRDATRLDGDTFCTLLLLLYGAGLRTSEALNLTMAEVDLADAVLTVRNAKFFKNRLVPVTARLADILRAYAERRSARPLPGGLEAPFLANRDGTKVRKHNVDYAFARLLAAAGIVRRGDGRRAPCLHALRHYIDCLTMSGTTGSRAIFVCNCRFGEGRLPGFPDIVLVDLQAAEKAEQPVTGLVAAGVAGWRRCFGQCLLFHCQRRLQIDLGGLNRFVSEPQRDHRAIDAGLKKVHGRRVAPMSRAT